MSTFQLYMNDDEEKGGVRLRVYGATAAPFSDGHFKNWKQAMSMARSVIALEAMNAKAVRDEGSGNNLSSASVKQKRQRRDD